jgi:hypothetical protein
MTQKTKSPREGPGGNSRKIVCETGVAGDRGNYSTRPGAQDFDFYGSRAEVISTLVVPLSRNPSVIGQKKLVTALNFENEMNTRLMQYAQNRRSKPCQLNGKSADKTNELKINIFFDPGSDVVGTKFVDFFSGKYFIPGFQYTRSDSFQGSFCDGG